MPASSKRRQSAPAEAQRKSPRFKEGSSSPRQQAPHSADKAYHQAASHHKKGPLSPTNMMVSISVGGSGVDAGMLPMLDAALLNSSSAVKIKQQRQSAHKKQQPPPELGKDDELVETLDSDSLTQLVHDHPHLARLNSGVRLRALRAAGHASFRASHEKMKLHDDVDPSDPPIMEDGDGLYGDDSEDRQSMPPPPPMVQKRIDFLSSAATLARQDNELQVDTQARTVAVPEPLIPVESQSPLIAVDTIAGPSQEEEQEQQEQQTSEDPSAEKKRSFMSYFVKTTTTTTTTTKTNKDQSSADRDDSGQEETKESQPSDDDEEEDSMQEDDGLMREEVSREESEPKEPDTVARERGESFDWTVLLPPKYKGKGLSRRVRENGVNPNSFEASYQQRGGHSFKKQQQRPTTEGQEGQEKPPSVLKWLQHSLMGADERSSHDDNNTTIAAVRVHHGLPPQDQYIKHSSLEYRGDRGQQAKQINDTMESVTKQQQPSYQHSSFDGDEVRSTGEGQPMLRSRVSANSSMVITETGGEVDTPISWRVSTIPLMEEEEGEFDLIHHRQQRHSFGPLEFAIFALLVTAGVHLTWQGFSSISMIIFCLILAVSVYVLFKPMSARSDRRGALSFRR